MKLLIMRSSPASCNFWLEIFSSETCSQTPSIFVPHEMSETKFRIHMHRTMGIGDILTAHVTGSSIRLTRLRPILDITA
jgi:hypothetical protein